MACVASGSTACAASQSHRLSSRSRVAPALSATTLTSSAAAAATPASRHRLQPRALIDPSKDVILVAGAKERTAQTVAQQLSVNERSAGVQVRVALPAACFIGITNPRDCMAKELCYPDQPMIDCLTDMDAVECLDVSKKDYQTALGATTGAILASEYAPSLLESVRELQQNIKAGKMPKLKRVVLMSHIGVTRRAVDPWRFMNRRVKGGGAPLDRWWEAEEELRAAATASEDVGWTYTIVRVGDLRGNGPTSVTYGDAMLTLVDNAFDVRMQDIEILPGDEFQGFTKRLSVAVVMLRMLTTQSFRVINKEFSVISTGPVDRERRMGWDVAKGRSPPPISDRTVDEELAPKEEEEAAPEGAPAPVPT
eukprot:CAMPEP_0197579490 /NCGR_PEP_ID=MMETSP1326-20131121/3489_1 /TAXON_ID=1155430 /ORGANISM="Genus nov. species nov., Strain RCC2288" /LENGTH=366 /DNA_ID=CAMNT_0043142971 /DNA_START=26 /DNA_END=1126 /DNA_ORIENTATION=-